MTARRFSLIVLILPALAFTVSCAGTRGRISKGEPLTGTARGAVMRALADRNASLTGLRGIATVRFGSAVFGARGETAFALQAPDRLRIDGLAEFGLYHSQLAIDRSRLAIVWPSDRRYFEGEATPENLGRYLLVGLPPETLLNILLGRVPVRDDEPGLKVFSGRKGGQVVIQGEKVEAVVEPRDGTYVPLHYTVTDADGKPVYRVAFEDYSREGRSLWFADRMRARFWENGPSRTKAKVDVEFKELEIDPKIDAKVFELKIPHDAEPVSDR